PKEGSFACNDKKLNAGCHPPPARGAGRAQFFAFSPPAAIAASAQASSLSLVSPVTPIAPSTEPPSSQTITPPAAGTMPPSLIVSTEAMKCGRSSAISPIVRLDTPSASAPQAFPPASLTRMLEAPSCRWQAIRCPPGSCTVTVSGLSPSSAPLAKAVSMRALAWARLRRCMRSAPLHLGRQAHQDGVDIAAGLEAEQGAAVVDQVELGVTTAPDELLLLLLGGPFLARPLADDLGEHVEERLADVPGESEMALPLGLVRAFHVVVEDPADPPRDAAVRDEEVLVGPLAEPVVVGRVVRHAGGAEGRVELLGVL